MNGTAIITGASSGIGKTTAEYFLNKHWRVINISRRNCPISDVININLDLALLSTLPNHKNLFLQHLNTTQKICLVHNAAMFHKDSIQDLTAETMQQVFSTNVIAPLILNQLLLPKMDRGSSIIFVGSTLSTKAVANTASYVTTKHALLGLMRATCQDLATPNIHTCCVCPGFTATEMLQQHLQQHSEVYENIRNRVHAHRLIEPQEIAELIYFCAEHPVINGATIHANLGQIEY